MPGVGPFDVLAPPGLDRGLVALMGDLPGHAASGELVAGLLRIVPGVEMDGDVAGQRPDVIEFVQRGGQERGVMPVCRGQHPAGRDALPPAMSDRFMPSLPRSTGLRPAHSPPPGALAMHPSTARVFQGQADDPVMGLPRDLLQLAEDPGLDPLVTAVPDRGGTAGAVGDRRIGAAEPQDLDEFFEDDPVGDPRLVAAQRVRGGVDRAVGQQCGELVPEGLQQP